ncbi:UNVERIFIED_CONTAM: AP-3 complex subunit beta-1 [Gekko kuhli]
MVLQKEEKILQQKRDLPKEVSLLDLDDFNPVSAPVTLSSVTLLCPTSAADLEGLSLSGSSVIDVSHFFMD